MLLETHSLPLLQIEATVCTFMECNLKGSTKCWRFHAFGKSSICNIVQLAMSKSAFFIKSSLRGFFCNR